MSDACFDADRLTRLRRVSAVAPSPCGTWLAVVVARLSQDESAYVSDLWRVSLDPARPPVRLTWGDDDDTGPRFRADGALAFLRTRRADGGPGDLGRTQVWLMPAVGGEPRPITDEPLGVRDFRLAGERLFVIADILPGVAHEEQRAHAADRARRGPSGLHYTTMPVRRWDHWLPAAVPHVIVIDDAGARRDLTPDAAGEHRESDLGVIAWDVTADGRRVAIAAERLSPDQCLDSALRLIDADSGARVDLGVLDGASHAMPRFAPDGRQLACVRGLRQPGQAETEALWIYDVPAAIPAATPAEPAAAMGRALAPGWDVWPALHTWTPDGAAVIATADVHGHVPVFRVDVATGEVVRLSAEAAGGSHGSLRVVAGSAGGADSGGVALVGIRHRLVHPPEPFRMDLRAGATPVLLAALSGFTAAEGDAMTAWEAFSTPGDGGTAVHGFVLLPRNRTEPHPALMWIHGGPVGQHADGWHWRWNALVAVAAGYAVVLPNPRGSSGFGQDFIHGVFNNEWGGACYRDLTAVTDAVCARSDIDECRMGAMGGSFGGYMANWIGGNTDRFRCLMTHAGVFHMSSFSGVTDYPGYFRYMLACSPYEDAETFDRYSPHRLIGQWKTPTLVIHGEKDYRVPISEALMLFTALQARGVDSELLAFPDENHWILRPRNIRQWYDTVLAFADRHLRGG